MQYERKLGLYSKYIHTVKSASGAESEYGMKEFLNRFVRTRTVGYFIVHRNRDTRLSDCRQYYRTETGEPALEVASIGSESS